MKDTKFRVWNVRRFMKDEEVAILPNGKLIFLVVDSESEYREMKFLDVKVSFYTGLKDKNGKEIYEGDIIEDDIGKGKVVYREQKGGYRVTYGDGAAKWFVDYTPDENKTIEVIGNIYENTDLLDFSS